MVGTEVEVLGSLAVYSLGDRGVYRGKIPSVSDALNRKCARINETCIMRWVESAHDGMTDSDGFAILALEGRPQVHSGHESAVFSEL